MESEREESMLTVLVMVNMKTYGMAEGTRRPRRRRVLLFGSFPLFFSSSCELLYTLVSLIWFGFLLLEEVFEILLQSQKNSERKIKRKEREMRWSHKVLPKKTQPSIPFFSFLSSDLCMYNISIFNSRGMKNGELPTFQSCFKAKWNSLCCLCANYNYIN